MIYLDLTPVTVNNTPSAVNAVLLSGGMYRSKLSSTEVFPPSSSCSLPPLPAARYYHTSFTTEAGLPGLCGGISRGYLSSCLEYNPSSRQWDTTTQMPQPRIFATASMLASGLYILGGRTTGNVGLSSSILLPAGSDSWTSGPELPGGTAVHGACSIKLHDSLLLIGGNPTFRQVREYNPQSGWLPEERWDQLASGRSMHSCAATAQEVVVAGGYRSGYLDSTEILQISTRKRRAGGRLQVPRSYFTMVAIQDSIVVLGGQGRAGRLNSVENWHNTSHTWAIDGSKLKQKRRNMGAVSISTDKICV